MDAVDFQDAVDKPQYEQQPDGSYMYTDEDGYRVHIPKKVRLDDAFTFQDDDLKEVILGVHPGDCVLTDEMKAVKPEEPFLQFGKAMPFRIMFYQNAEPGPWSYNEAELKFLKEFKEFCKKKNLATPECDAEILRWAYPNKMHSQKTYNAILGKHKLINDKFPFPMSKKSFELLDQGMIHVAGRDRMYRPILIIRYKVITTQKPPPEVNDLIGAALLTLLFIDKYMIENGSIENILQIGDFSGTSIRNMPIKLMKGIGQFLTQFIRGKQRVIFMLSAPKTISFIWNTVKYILDENTQQKVQFTTSNINPSLLKMCHPSQLEQRYGGTAKNREDGEYWPPKMNSTTYGYGEQTDMTDVQSLKDSDMIKMSVVDTNDQELTEAQLDQKFAEAQKELEKVEEEKQQE